MKKFPWNPRWRWLLVILAALLPAASPTHAQPAPQAAAKEIRDPFTGAAWRLVRDEAHPGGPGRLLLVEPGSTASASAKEAAPVIHAGDRIVVEEHSAVADARLEAIALMRAARGETLRVRMVLGGAILTVRALAAGSAEFQTGAAQ